uniref:Importin-11-like isoform x1 n=1 Tax=Tetraselmis sp. GSL018 TaxID=582737 RepID=A0A061R0T2_9CHLO
MRGASEHETELKAFGLMSLIVERLGESLKPFLPSVLALLPEVWGHSEGNSLLRMQVMVALQSLLNVLGPESPSAYGVVLPILNSATDPANPEEANLLEDGLALWLVALRNAASPHPGLLGIFPNLHAVMARSTEHIQSACSIMVSAILLGGASFLQQHGAPLLAIITDALGAVNERGMLLLLPVVETIIVGFPQEAPLSLERPLAKLLSLLLGGGESTAVAAAACGLYARLLLNRPDEWLGYFHRYASQVPLPPDAPEAPSPGERLMLAFLDRWLAQLDTIAQPSARKLSGLALCHLFRVGSGGIVDRLETIIAAVTGLFHESEAGPDDGGRAVYGFDYSASTGLRVQADEPQAVLDSEDAEGETVRKRRLLESDPVNHQKISKVLRGSLELCTKVHGTRFETALQAADPVLTNQLRAVLQAP